MLLSFHVIKLCIATTIIVEPRLMREVRGRAIYRHRDILARDGAFNVVVISSQCETWAISRPSGFFGGYGNVSVRRENAPRSRSRPLSRFRIFTAKLSIERRHYAAASTGARAREPQNLVDTRRVATPDKPGSNSRNQIYAETRLRRVSE